MLYPNGGSHLTLRDALAVLSKSSAYSVATPSERAHDARDSYKEYLYLEQPIERDFRAHLESIQPGQVLFLCGSSGDGKSEIMTRAVKLYGEEVIDFHLDATHSFSPQETAIEALDDRFARSKSTRRPLVVGINVGMMGNFASDGSNQHDDIKTSIRQFLSPDEDCENPSHLFLDFESYPKFRFAEDGWHADFPSQFMKRLTKPEMSNPFYSLAKQKTDNEADHKLAINFNLLAREDIQKCVARALFKARLFSDQFLTARALLDFIHHLLLGDGYLPDNLFTLADNDLAEKVVMFDPAEWHSQTLDLFVMKHNIELVDEELDSFLQGLRAKGLWGGGKPTAKSLLRLFYVFRHARVSNDYHHRFCRDFRTMDQIFETYSRHWYLHSAPGKAKEKEARKELRAYYQDAIIPALRAYANRAAPDIGRNDIYLATHNGVRVCAKLDILPDLARIGTEESNGIFHFTARVKVNDQSLSFPVSISLLELLVKVRAGYMPNRYDRNSVVVLDDTITKVTTIAKRATTVSYNDGHSKADIDCVESDYFEVRWQ